MKTHGFDSDVHFVPDVRGHWWFGSLAHSNVVMKVVRKFIQAEAEQWQSDKTLPGVTTEPLPEMPYGVYECLHNGINNNIPRCAAVKTVKGWHLVTPGDWVVTDPNGERRVYDAETFKEQYTLSD